MQNPDDVQFEAYLKRFRPIAPQPVPILSAGASPRHWHRLGLAAAAAIFVIGSVILHIRISRIVVSNRASDAAVVQPHAPSEPLTMRNANAWLATAPSLKAAVDDLAFRSQTSPLPQGEQSAVAVLSKEKIKL